MTFPSLALLHIRHQIAYQLEGEESMWTYFRWSSIMQLASNMAVGLAMFLSAILFPVFLVAWNSQKYSCGLSQNTLLWMSLMQYELIFVRTLFCCVWLSNYEARNKHSLFQKQRSPDHSWPRAQGQAPPPGRRTRCLLRCRTDWASPSHQTAQAWTPTKNTQTSWSRVGPIQSKNKCIV